MNLAEIYRRRFLARQGFAGGSNTFTPSQAYRVQLSEAGFLPYEDAGYSDDLKIEPTSLNEYLGFREMNKQQQSGRGLALGLDKYRVGRRYNRFLKYA